MQGNKKQKTQSSRRTNEATLSHTKISPDQLVEEIRKRAQEIFVERGSGLGDPITDWLRAEKEINSKYRVEV